MAIGFVQIGEGDYVRADLVNSVEPVPGGGYRLHGDFSKNCTSWDALTWTSSSESLIDALNGYYTPGPKDWTPQSAYPDPSQDSHSAFDEKD
jgi:hypothetical protein